MSPLYLILPDQPNRALRTRMLRGVGGAPCEGCPYPDIGFLLTLQLKNQVVNTLPSNIIYRVSP